MSKRRLLVLFSALAAILVVALMFRQLITFGPDGRKEEMLISKVDDLIGATVEPLDSGTARAIGVVSDSKGLIVTSIATHGPAARAGLRPGDVIEAMGARHVRDLADAQAVGNVPGPVTLTVNRNGHHATVRLLVSPTAEAAADSDPGG